jgi:hypothetical protein
MSSAEASFAPDLHVLLVLTVLKKIARNCLPAIEIPFLVYEANYLLSTIKYLVRSALFQQKCHPFAFSEALLGF